MYRHPIYMTVAILFMGVLSNNAFALTCERTSRSAEGFTTSAAFDSWHPKEIAGRHSKSLVWEEAGKGSKALVAELSLGQDTMRYRLLPNGKMIAKLLTQGNYQDTAHVSYKCDKNSNEMRQLIASGNAANTNSTNSSSSGVTNNTPTTTSTSKLDKAKSTCTELGFALGTEKHGDCVLKMMDN